MPISSCTRQPNSFRDSATCWAESCSRETSPVRDSFSREVLGKSVPAVEQYWTQAIFSGRAVPPVEKRTDADVLAYVRETPGAIGYVSASTPTEGVKRLALRD